MEEAVVVQLHSRICHSESVCIRAFYDSDGVGVTTDSRWRETVLKREKVATAEDKEEQRNLDKDELNLGEELKKQQLEEILKCEKLL